MTLVSKTGLVLLIFLALAGQGGAQELQKLKPKATAKAASDGTHLAAGPYRWVDVHMHLVPVRGDFSGSVMEALRLMDRAGISFAIISPTPQSPPHYSEREYVHLLKRHPERFGWLGGGGDLNHMIHRTDPSKVTDSIRKEFVAKAEAILMAGARGFGEMAVLHVSLLPGHPFEQTKADHPLFLALADIAATRNAVIDIHIDLIPVDGPTPPNLPKAGNPAKLIGNVEAFERLLSHNRAARFILEHVGADPVGHANTELLTRLISAHPNLYLAIRAAPHGVGMQNTIVGPQGILPAWRSLLTSHADRFLYGSDSFVISPDAGAGPGAFFAQRNVNKLALHNRILAALPPDVAFKIAVENPRKLFRLPSR